jgi:hypothetical protein
MAHILKDVLMGSTIVVLGMVVSLVAALVLLILWIFFHLLGALLCVFFVIFLFFFGLWIIGFLYRKTKETSKK